MSYETRARPTPATGHRGQTSVDEDRLRTPLTFLGFAAGAVGLSGLLLVGRGRAIDFAGYVLATIVTVLLVSVFRSVDSRRRSRPNYVIPAIAEVVSPTVMSWLLLGAGVAVGAVHVWRFAEVVARS